MKKSLGAKGQMFPQLVMIIGSYGEDGIPDAMNAAWATMRTMGEIEIHISSHQSTDNILARRAFTIAPATEDTLVASDYVGMVSGRKVADKAAKSGLTFVKSEHVDAPVMEEFPLTMECEVVAVEGDASDAHIVGKIVNTLADESVLDDQGRVDFGKLKPVIYDGSHRSYRSVGAELGQAWATGKALM